MVLLRRWIPSCVRRNSTHGIPSSQLRSTPLARGQPDSQQPRNLDILKRHKLLYWEHSGEAQKYADITPVIMNMFWLYFKDHTSCFFLEELYTILSDIVGLMYHRLISFRVSHESDQTLKSASWITLFMNAVPIPQGSQWQNETKLQHSHSTV